MPHAAAVNVATQPVQRLVALQLDTFLSGAALMLEELQQGGHPIFCFTVQARDIIPCKVSKQAGT